MGLELAILSIPCECPCKSELPLRYSAVQTLSHRPEIENHYRQDQIIFKGNVPAVGEWPAGSAPDHKLLDRGRGEARGTRVLILLTFSAQCYVFLALGQETQKYLNMLCISLPAGPREAPSTFTSPPLPRLDTNLPISSTLGNIGSMIPLHQ